MGQPLVRLPIAATTTAPASKPAPPPIKRLLARGPRWRVDGTEGVPVGPRYWERNSRSWVGSSLSFRQANAGLARPARTRQAKTRPIGKLRGNRDGFV